MYRIFGAEPVRRASPQARKLRREGGTDISMSQISEDEKPLDPAQARIVARMRWLMLISGFATVLGIFVVFGVIGYRVFRSDSTVRDVTAALPKGARIVQTAVAGDLVVVTLDIAGVTEVRSFDAKTMRQVARLRFVQEP
jgi:hypothetical protein